MSKKKPKFADGEEKMEEVWDFKKIGIGIVLLVLVIAGGLIAKRLILHQSIAPSSFIPQLPTVKGASIGPISPTPLPINISLPSQHDVQQQVQQIQQQVTQLNVQEIATTSPQVLGILKQIQDLPSGPIGQVKDACLRLCNNL